MSEVLTKVQDATDQVWSRPSAHSCPPFCSEQLGWQWVWGRGSGRTAHQSASCHIHRNCPGRERKAKGEVLSHPTLRCVKYRSKQNRERKTHSETYKRGGNTSVMICQVKPLARLQQLHGEFLTCGFPVFPSRPFELASPRCWVLNPRIFCKLGNTLTDD